jgi:hypothetical protein
MKNLLARRAWLAMALILAVLCGAGCTSVSLDSVSMATNEDKAAVHKVDRLFIVVNQGEGKNQPLSQSLVKAFQGCFTNATPQMDITVVSPLDLDENAYQSRISNFNADAVLVIAVKTFIVDETGGYPVILYDASLYEPTLHKRIWRAAINNSGGTALMDRRMREMAEKIVQQLHQDGFL